MKNKSGTELTSLKKNNEILFVLKKGHRLHTKTLTLWYFLVKTNKIEYGLMANKSTFKLAVVRNKIKRQLRMMLNQTSSFGGIKILIKPNINYLQNNYEQNKKDLQALLNNIRNKNGN